MNNIKIKLWLLKCWLIRIEEKVFLWFVWKLPKRIVYWCLIRIWAAGTTGDYGNTHPDELNWGTALDRFMNKSNQDKK